MAMRVTDSALYRKYTTSVNDVHSQFNKSMNKISSGAAYETAAENPLAYYSGKRMDNQFQDVLSKQQLLTDIQNRLHQQELGARSIQETLDSGLSGKTVKSQISSILNTTNNELSTTVATVRDDLIQKQQTMVNDLNAQYQNFYVYGGNDLSTAPFALSYNEKDDKLLFTYSHTFTGDPEPTKFVFSLEEDADGFAFKLQPDADATWEKLQQAMSEQGCVDVGYGSVHDPSTLIDTYTGGLNLLTGITSDTVRTQMDAQKTDPTKADDHQAAFEKALANSAIGLTGQAIVTMNQYIRYLDDDRTVSPGAIDKDEFDKKLRYVMDEIVPTSNRLSSVYSDLGNKYNQLENTADRLETDRISLLTQYSEVLGADPYDAIVEMYSNYRSYQASLQVTSNLMSMSLFNYMR